MDKFFTILLQKIPLHISLLQKKQLCIMLLGSMLTPTSCNAMSNILNVLSEDMNEDWKNNNYPDQLPTEKNA